MIRIRHEATVVDVLALADIDPDLALLPPEDQDRHARFVDREAADSYLRRQSALRRRLGDELSIPPGEVVLNTIGNQKPIVAGPQPKVHFNLSASGPLMVLAIDPTGPIGVDIECHDIHRGLQASSLSPALHPQELAALAGDDLDDILQCWVFKEAWIKWTAEGMRADLKALRLWQPGLAEAFVHAGAAVRLHKIGPGTALGTDGHAAWVGLVKAAVSSAGGPADRGL